MIALVIWLAIWPPVERDSEVEAAVLAACEGRSETSGEYPIDCECFRACVSEGDLDTQDCVGICD